MVFRRKKEARGSDHHQSTPLSSLQVLRLWRFTVTKGGNGQRRVAGKKSSVLVGRERKKRRASR